METKLDESFICDLGMELTDKGYIDNATNQEIIFNKLEGTVILKNITILSMEALELIYKKAIELGME